MKNAIQFILKVLYISIWIMVGVTVVVLLGSLAMAINNTINLAHLLGVIPYAIIVCGAMWVLLKIALIFFR